MNKSDILWIWIKLKWGWYDYRLILSSLQQEQELANLTQWAKRKRLKGVSKYYESLLWSIQSKLMSFRWKNRRIYEIAVWSQCLALQLLPKATYQKGYAKKYSRRAIIEG
jgi:hypothetical protein